MSSAAQSRGLRKGTRDALQALVAVLAAGGTTVAIEAFFGTVAPAYSGLLAVAYKILLTYLQNYLETAGKIPVLLPSPGLVSAVLDPVTGAVLDKTPLIAPAAAATVDAVSDKTGAVTGTVTDLVGDTVGEVTGQLPSEDEPTIVQDDRPVNEAGESLNKDGSVSKRQPTSASDTGSDPAPL